MAYCTASDVASLNRGRHIGQGANPTLADVAVYVAMAAGEIDGILVDRGYQVPVGSQYPEAWALLNAVNAQGAVAMMEEASPSSTHADRARKAYEDSKEMLRTARQAMNAPKDFARSDPRGPGLTTTPTGATYDPALSAPRTGDGLSAADGNDPAAPYFSRQMPF